MRRFLILCTALWVMIFTIPLLTIRPWEGEVPVDRPALAAATDANDTQETAKSIDAATNITLCDNGSVVTLPLDEYLAGVVAAEIPASFPEAAMKAQVVAARTYTMNRASVTPAAAHNGAMVCSNPGHCKAYKPITVAAAGWGKMSESYTEKIKKAVADTDGEILLYNNKPISAVFFAMSSGKTERAADVWGTDIPYLQSVESEGETKLSGFSQTVTLSAAEFQQKFRAKHANAQFGDDPSTWISQITRSDAGGVMTLRVGGVALKGTELRMLYGLRSTNFSAKCTKDSVTFETRGYGHGVGMSQYGARLLAEEGKNYRDILNWYYKGVTFGKIAA